MDNFEEWSVDLTRAERLLVPGAILKLQRSLVFLTLGAAVEISPGRFRKISGVVLLTPVDTGRARSSWNVSRGEPDGSVRSGGGRDSKGRYQKGGSRAPTAATASGVMRSLGVYETVWIASGLPYIKVLEYGGYPQSPVRGSWDRRTRSWVVKSAGGYSKQAPRGMVRITVAGVKAALEG